MGLHNAILQVDQLSKRFGKTIAVDNVSFTVDEGDIVCLLGPSGCGKTTLLRLVAGLDSADTGTITFANQSISSIPPHLRNFGLVFQQFALFPHLNVYDNIAYGLKTNSRRKDNTKQRKQAINAQVTKMLDLVDLSGFERRTIDQLSGGQQQRVALARSLATEPKLLMLDEPLGALDRALREKLMVDLRHIIKQIGLTALYVTHDQSEAYAIGDKVAVMHNGAIVQHTDPQTLFAHPCNRFVARFLGFPNILIGTVETPTEIDTPIGRMTIAQATDHAPGSTVDILIRPNAITDKITPNQFSAEILSNTFRGRFHELRVRIGATVLIFEIGGGFDLLSAETTTLNLDPTQIIILNKSTTMPPTS